MEKRLVDEFKDILTQRKEAILTQLNENAQHLQGLQNSAPSDSADFSAINNSSQIEQIVAKNLRQELGEIAISLAKIKQEKFGNCELCGGEIDLERLKIKPHARFCINCREIVEREKR